MAQEKAALSKIAGGNLAHMLWQRCISQKEFAAIVDRTPRTVRRWMYEGIPTLDDLQTITEALGVSVMDILSDSEAVHYFYMRGNLMSVFGKVLPRFDHICYNEWLDQMECRLVLSRNCRNTKEIAITSTRPIGLEESRIKMRREFDSFSTWKPKLFFVDGKTTLQEYLAKLIKKYTAAGIKEKDIVVLSMKPEGKSMLQQSDLCISGKYILSREPKENSIFFTTVRKFKGLEAEVIICIDIDKETFSSPQERNVFYVGTSRAMAYLDLLSLSSPEELATAIDGGEIYSKRPQAIKAVRDCLKVKIASAFDLTDDMDS